MASIVAKVVGGDKQFLDDVDTVQDAFDQLQLEGNYTAMVNREPASFEDELDDDDFVTFTVAVKAGLVSA